LRHPVDRANEHTDAPVSAARTSWAREVGQKAREHINHRPGESAGYFIIALADDQKAVAPVDRPHTVRF
jgi:hypothetical protein